ncbi:dihydrofolate reductase [Niveibacterium umoris]|uniref:Dihydrofolate reductase n=1 Tax=Niveibacterium umoris TaxID=1193620 RepID=A0A840BG45_9RHOO|nr:dihydrofolate reductase [Niveibacterium umoris]MBB4012511.1 dihydrofolate reductase [Niveibacterium umoris]
MPRLALIAAVAQNGTIGRDNALPWRLRDDLKRFKALTLGHPVVMGRKTWESLGRPLPGRRNIVVTRQPGLVLEGAEVVHSLDEALAGCNDADTVFVIGGAQLYREALGRADALYLTEVGADVEGDAHFPPIGDAGFREVARESHAAGEGNEHPFSFVDYIRA